MSLINKMLTDLEARQNPAADRSPPGDVYRDLHPAVNNSKRLWPVVVFLVCTTAIAVAGVFTLDRWEFEEIAEWAVDWGEAAQQQVALVVRAPVAEERQPVTEDRQLVAEERQSVAEDRQSKTLARATEVFSRDEGAVSSKRAPTWIAVAATQHPAALVSLAGVAEAANINKVAVAFGGRQGTTGKPAVAMPQPQSEARAATRKSAKTNMQSKTASSHSHHTPHPETKEKQGFLSEKPATQVSALSQTPRSPPTGSIQQGMVEKKVKALTAAEQAENAYRKSVRLLEQNRLSDAEMALRQALEGNPRQVEARELLAELVIRRGRLNEAQQLLEEGRQLVPEYYRFAQLLGRLYVQRGVEQKGLALLEQVQDDAQGDAEFLGFLAALYQRAGRHQEAIKTYTRAVNLDSGQSQWWVALGISLEAEQSWGAAYSAYIRALRGQQLEQNLVRYAKQRATLLKRRVATN